MDQTSDEIGLGAPILRESGCDTCLRVATKEGAGEIKAESKGDAYPEPIYPD